MIPFVRTVGELEQTIKIMEQEGLKRSHDFKLWMMVEVPSNIFLMEKFLEAGIDGTHGKLYNGKVSRNIATSFVANILKESIDTRTKVYVNLAQPELADLVAARKVDGVGLLRAEFIIAQIGQHPSYMLKRTGAASLSTSFTRASTPLPKPSAHARWSTEPPILRPMNIGILSAARN